jgi:hypothetical protein
MLTITLPVDMPCCIACCTQLHWPARYTPQANWGQSLAYRQVTRQLQSVELYRICIFHLFTVHPVCPVLLA